MLREYGFQVVVPDVITRNNNILPDSCKYPKEVLARVYALGWARAKVSGSIEWILRHKSLRVYVESDLSLRATEVSFIVTYDDKDESPPSDDYILREGIDMVFEGAV